MTVGERLRFSDSALDDVASILCANSIRAPQYLEQAPACALLACGKYGSHISYGEVDRFVATISPEPKLRDLLASFKAPLAIRKLSAHALRSGDAAAIEYLCRLDPSTLSQCIPCVDGQRAWLDGLKKWLVLLPTAKRARAQFSVAWIARQLGEDQGRVEQLDSLIDYLRRGRQAVNVRWTWQSAMAAVARWHAELNDIRAIERALQDSKRAASFDKPVCKAPLPDRAAVDGYDFIVLRTPRMIRDEGVAMHHCAGSYISDVKKGACAIISVSRDAVRIATLEILSSGALGQIKAHCNAAPPLKVREACGLYALTHWRPEPESAAA